MCAGHEPAPSQPRTPTTRAAARRRAHARTPSRVHGPPAPRLPTAPRGLAMSAARSGGAARRGPADGSGRGALAPRRRIRGRWAHLRTAGGEMLTGRRGSQRAQQGAGYCCGKAHHGSAVQALRRSITTGVRSPLCVPLEGSCGLRSVATVLGQRFVGAGVGELCRRPSAELCLKTRRLSCRW